MINKNFLFLRFLTIGLLFLIGCNTDKGDLETVSTSDSLDNLAKCLTEKDAKMYGASWCSHCQDQKKSFGESWQHVNYIECSLPGGNGQTEVCSQAGIQGYPTWEFADGTRKSGKLSLESLSELSGCS